MSNNMNSSSTIRWQLLSTVSALALLGSVYTAEAAGNDADRPLIWIELGGQMENVSGQGEIFTPAFLANYPTSTVLQSATPLQAQRVPKFSFGEEGRISFQPEGSDWSFSAAIRYGRSNNFRHVQHQTTATHVAISNGVPTNNIQTTAEFADTQVHHHESHSVIDFQVGRDVGLGMFGKGSSSVLNLGVRFAQFNSGETFDLRARPDLYVKYFHFGHRTSPIEEFHVYHATGQASRGFHGVGPSLSWNGATPFAGNLQDGELTFDWGANAALLFGRQRASVRHHETAHARNNFNKYTSVYNHPSSGHPTSGHDTDRRINVPDVGGFAGLSYRYADAKISLGYRADFFFGAMDAGIDAVKKSNAAFNGPYASISVGLGD